jgi:hypothetical protein
MRRLWSEFRSSKTARTVAGVSLLALWVLTILTWMFDDGGYSVGMPGWVFALHLAAPLVFAVWIGWQQESFADGLKAGLIAGAAFASADVLVLYVWSGILIALGKVSPDAEIGSIWAGLFEALAMGVFNLIEGAVFGVVGGGLGATARLLGRAKSTPNA